MKKQTSKRSRGRPASPRTAKRANGLAELLEATGARTPVFGPPLDQMIQQVKAVSTFMAAARRPTEENQEEILPAEEHFDPHPKIPATSRAGVPITKETVHSWEASQTAGLIRLDEEEMQAVQWLWEGRIPMAKCTLLVGDPDAGKSFLTLDLAARVSRGLGVPPEPGLGEPGSVLLLSADDHIRDTILPRLHAAGADLSRIALLPKTIRPERSDKDRLLSLATDIDRLERGLAELGDCRLVVIDPISAYLKGVDTYNNIAVRHHLLKLSDLAERYGAAFLLVSHQRKSGAPTAMYRAIGSLAFTAVARVVLVVTADQAVAGRRLLLPVKMTLQTAESGRAFSIVPCDPLEPCEETSEAENVSGELEKSAVRAGRVEWEPEVVPYTADERYEFVKSGEASIDAVREAVVWLKQLLDDERRPAEEVQRLALARGVPKSVLWAAKKQACVKAVHEGKENKWYWQRLKPWYHGMIQDDEEWEAAKRRAKL
jgi:putative DNA primase/helicase